MDSNRDLFWQLIEPEHFKARAYCRKLMGNREDGDDLYQDALVRALTRFRSLRKRESFRPWFYRIIGSVFKNRVKQPWWRKMISLTSEDVQQPATQTVETSIETRERLALAFATLSPDEVSLVVLHELQG